MLVSHRIFVECHGSYFYDEFDHKFTIKILLSCNINTLTEFCPKYVWITDQS